MRKNRREFRKASADHAWGGSLLAAAGAVRRPADPSGKQTRSVTVALVQFDSVPAQVAGNLDQMERLAGEAARSGARWILFHELTVCDYADRPEEMAEPVPGGSSTRRMIRLAGRLQTFIAFGLAEKDRGRIYDSVVLVGPRGYLYHYRKTWLWFMRSDEGYRDEWARFDPGTGPELFSLDGVRATCFICADSNSRRCMERAVALKPQVVLFPINRVMVSSHEEYGAIARKIGAPMLVANRVGRSVAKDTLGGCVVSSPGGKIPAIANMDGRKEILLHRLHLAAI